MRDGKRRVLWVIKGLGPGGAERLLCAAARAHDHDRLHIECAYVLPWKDHLAEELEQAGVRTHCMSKRRVDRLWPLRLARIVRSGNWDVIHVHSPLPGSVARLAAVTLRNAKRPLLVTTEHNRWVTYRLPTRLANRLTSRWDEIAFAVSDEVRASMSGPVARRAETLRHGIDVRSTASATAERTAVRAEFRLGADDFVVGTVANFRPQKDYPNLLQAARILADRNISFRFVAVGQGPDEEKIRGLRDDLGLTDHVILTGFRDDAIRIMGACDIFVLASQWEGLPVALMEALAIGLPVVATAVGGIAEELTNEVDALLVPPRDAGAMATAIELLSRDEQLRGSLRRASLRRASSFDVSHAIKRLGRAYGVSASHAHIPERSPQPRRTVPTAVDIRRATPNDRTEIIGLCRASLGWSDDFRFEQLFLWKHEQNPFGPSCMWVATDQGRIVGFRAFMRWMFNRDGEVLRTVRAVDTCIHPDYQGRGLFTAMTLQAVEELRAEEIDFVFNTPNEQSWPGYAKMGWSVVGRLPAYVRCQPRGAWRTLRSHVPASHWPERLGLGRPITSLLDELAQIAGEASAEPRRLATQVDREFLAWRYGFDFLGYRFVPYNEGGVIVRLRNRGVAQELVLLSSLGLEERDTARILHQIMTTISADHTLRLGTQSRVHGGFPVRGPVLAWRSVTMKAMPTLPNWSLTMGDIELF